MKNRVALLSGCVFGLVLGYSDNCYGYASYSEYLASKGTSIEQRQQQIIDQEPVVNRGGRRFANTGDRPIDRVNEYYSRYRWTRGTSVDQVFDQQSEQGFSQHSMMNTVPFGERTTEEGYYTCFLGLCALPWYVWQPKQGSRYIGDVHARERAIVRQNRVKRFGSSFFNQFGE